MCYGLLTLNYNMNDELMGKKHFNAVKGGMISTTVNSVFAKSFVSNCQINVVG